VLQAGDVIALCSDGLWGVLDDEEIAERLARGPLVRVVPELVEQAEMEAGPNSDNVSLIAMRWEEGEPSLAPDTVSTETMALDQVTTAFSLPQQPPGFGDPRQRRDRTGDPRDQRDDPEIQGMMHEA